LLVRTSSSNFSFINHKPSKNHVRFQEQTLLSPYTCVFGAETPSSRPWWTSMGRGWWMSWTSPWRCGASWGDQPSKWLY
jgi:hypothetical protein